VCCSVLKCVALCSVLQRNSVVQRVASCSNEMQCSELQCAAVHYKFVGALLEVAA